MINHSEPKLPKPVPDPSPGPPGPEPDDPEPIDDPFIPPLEPMPL